MDRRRFLSAALAGLAALPLGAGHARADGAAEDAYSFERLIEQARALADHPDRPRVLELTGPFADLTYDSYRAIRFRPEERLWSGAAHAFRVEMFPPGFYHREGVDIALVSNGRARPVAFSPRLFDFDPAYFDADAAESSGTGLGFSGFRMRHPINDPDVLDEFLVFQGASYLRAIGRGTLYGLSARGLAIDTARPEGEEFPRFSHFWLHEPREGRMAVTIDALLESASITGAFRFEVSPGDVTAMDVEAHLFPRRLIDGAGIAPLTSMYFFGPEQRRLVDDFRYAVHDSQGLEMVTGRGEPVWRPLANPRMLQVSAFVDDGPRLFGLTQRRRDFHYYHDAEAAYHRRASAWVEPRGDWGRGHVVLVEIPTVDEFNDNIVAFWRPANPLEPGQPHRFDYRLSWGDAPPASRPVARVDATRAGQHILDAENRQFVIDFRPNGLEAGDLTPVVTASTGTISGVHILDLTEAGMIRTGFTLEPDGADLVELRLQLHDRDGRPASETWLYRWTPT